MTTPASITVSLEMAEKLKEAGWPQDESLYWWIQFFNTSSTTPDELLSDLITDDEWQDGYQTDAAGPIQYRSFLKDLRRYAAPTAEEILRRLPVTLPLDDHNHLLTVDIGGESLWELNYINSNGRAYWIDNGKTLIHTKDHSLANAAAAMWCYLAENKLLPSA